MRKSCFDLHFKRKPFTSGPEVTNEEWEHATVTVMMTVVQMQLNFLKQNSRGLDNAEQQACSNSNRTRALNVHYSF